MYATSVLTDVRALLKGEPVYLAGSLAAAHAYGLPFAFSDVDVFCPTQNVLISTGRKLIDAGFTLDDRMSRVWARWLKIGMKSWHTNSLKLTSPQGQEFNLVYKLMDGHPTTSLGQVIESFDFGLLAVGLDCESDTWRDMRDYLFPGVSRRDPLPLMPNKRDNWRGGFISQYNGIREVGRYAKYHTYGYDMSAVKEDLVEGYRMGSLYYCNHFKPEMQMLGKIFEVCAQHIEVDNIDELLEAAKIINYTDSLDVIMEALE